MAIKWTTPLRRAGIHVLPNIPNEIYFEIFDYLEPSEDISAAEYKATMCKLALVCRFFSAMCLPRAFKSLIYDGEFKGNSKDEPSHAPFSRALLKGTKQAGTLAPFVKKCTFRNWSNDSKLLKEVFDAFTSLHLRAITRFDNLETLHFSHVMMQPIHFKAISMIKRLKHLTLTRCTNVTIGTLPKKLFKELVSLDITSSRLDTSLSISLLHFSKSAANLLPSRTSNSALKQATSSPWAFFVTTLRSKKSLSSTAPRTELPMNGLLA
ncbi:hypothetical protein PLICRDRAFT_325686 [Plicaturopsis crispa FD-325 SS-3]|nr:hypothetical protein PLICRDRAFT_325686 [Plicaturopsis crispa FD-325 SS-3]